MPRPEGSQGNRRTRCGDGRVKGVFFGIVAAVVISIAIWFIAWLFGATTPLSTFAAAALVLGILLGAIGWVLGALGGGLSKLYDIIVNEVPANHFGHLQWP